MPELLNRLQKLGASAEVIENQALKAGAEIVQVAASAKVAKSPHTKEHLMDNIVISNIKKQDGAKCIHVGPHPQFFYSRFLEFGTSKMQARPFLYPAMVETEQAVIDAMRDTINNKLELRG